MAEIVQWVYRNGAREPPSGYACSEVCQRLWAKQQALAPSADIWNQLGEAIAPTGLWGSLAELRSNLGANARIEPSRSTLRWGVNGKSRKAINLPIPARSHEPAGVCTPEWAELKLPADHWESTNHEILEFKQADWAVWCSPSGNIVYQYDAPVLGGEGYCLSTFPVNISAGEWLEAQWWWNVCIKDGTESNQIAQGLYSQFRYGKVEDWTEGSVKVSTEGESGAVPEPSTVQADAERVLGAKGALAAWIDWALSGEHGPDPAELAVTPGEEYGEDNHSASGRTGCYAGGSVNCATGNETQALNLLSVGGRGPKLGFSLTYNSQLASSAKAIAGHYGYGWTGSYSAHTEETETNVRTVFLDDGSAVRFIELDGEWKPVSPLDLSTLTEEGETYVFTLPDQTKLRFSHTGLLSSEEDRDGNRLTLNRGTEERLESVSDAEGRKIGFGYSAEGFVETITDPMGHKVKLTNAGGILSTITLPGEEKARCSFKYDAEHQITSETDGRGDATEREYSEHRVISETDPLKRTRKWEYSASFPSEGETVTITNPGGEKTQEVFNAFGLPTSVTRAYGTSLAATTYDGYGPEGRLLNVTNPDGFSTEYGYDEAGDRTSEKNADDDEWKWEYDKTHDVISETTPMGEKTTIKREAHGNPEVIERPAPAGKTQLYEYKRSSKGDLESYTDPLKRTWKYEVDNYGERSAEIDPLGGKRTWGYDEDSFVTSTVSPRGHVKAGEEAKYTTKIERDAQERPITITDPLGHTTKIKRDGDGNVETITDANDHTTTLGWDADDEQTSIKEANGDTSETEYDAAGQITAQIDGNKHKTKYERNLLEEVTEQIDPLGHRAVEEYDRAGNLEKISDPEKRTTTIKRDPASSPIEISYSDGKTHAVELEYDKDGQRVKMVDGTGATTYERDQLERPTKIRDGHGDTAEYEWDLANENTKLTYPSGKSVERKFDGAGRLEKTIDWLGNTISFGWNSDSYQTSTTFPSATKDEDKTTLNAADQVTTIDMKDGTEALASITTTRDNDGQVKGITQKQLPGEEKPAVAMDEDNRLTKYGTSELKYDAANNPEKLGSASQTFSATDELEKAGTTAFSYAEDGERTKQTPEKGPATSYGWNQAQDLTSLERPEGEGKAKIEDSFASNGDGLRTSQTINGATSYLTWDLSEASGLPLLLSDGTNSYIYGPGGLPVEQIVTKEAKEQAQYLHRDQAGSTRLITGGAGTVEGKCSYGAYGTPTCEGAASSPLGYDGQYTNSDTGLIYLRARVYDPSTAQFLSRDPLVSLTREPYAYGADNPINLGDPTGYEALPLPIEGPGGLALCADPVTAALCAGAAGYGAVEEAKALWNAFANQEEGDEGEAELKQKEAERENCGNPATPPGSGFEWRGKGEPGSDEGSWFDEETDEYLRPHLRPSSHGPHYDYRAPDESEWRIYPDGRIEPKLP